MQQSSEHRKRWVGLTLLAGLMLAVVWWSASEPHHEGRALDEWIRAGAEARYRDAEEFAQYRAALLAMTPTRVVPVLLGLIQTPETPARSWLVNKTLRWADYGWQFPEADTLQLRGMVGFVALGTNAAFAIPKLERLLLDTNYCLIAAECLGSIGGPAESAFCRALTNPWPQVRGFSIFTLSELTANAEVYLERIKPCLTDPDLEVCVAAVGAIGERLAVANLAVPLLQDCLSHSHQAVRQAALVALRGFGTNAEATFEPVSRLVHSRFPEEQAAALSCLAEIAPQSSLSILSNAAATAEERPARVALSQLRELSPELGLKLTLEAFRHPDAGHRRMASRVAYGFTNPPPALVAALQTAADDADAEVARHAEGTIKGMVRRAKEQQGKVVRFGDDPVVQGKPLEDWLREGSDLIESPDAGLKSLKVLQSGGTNLLPALLQRFHYRDPVFNTYDAEIGMMGAQGLIAIGEMALPAVPELLELMRQDEPDQALHAMVAALGSASGGLQTLVAGLTNRFPMVQTVAYNYLTGEWIKKHPEIQPQVTRLLSNTPALLDHPMGRPQLRYNPMGKWR